MKSFREVAARLNNYHLSDLLLLSSALSVLDHHAYTFSPSGHSPLHPAVNPLNLELFTKAILDSSAQDYKSKPINARRLLETMGLLIDRLEIAPHLQGRETEASPYELLAPSANAQFRWQGLVFPLRAARTYALHVALPRDERTRLTAALGARFVDLDATFSAYHGLSVTAFLRVLSNIYWIVSSRYTLLHHNLNANLARFKFSLSETDRAGVAIDALIQTRQQSLASLAFTASELLHARLEQVSAAEVDATLRLIARPVRELRTLQSQQPLVSGYTDSSLNVLERFPVVALQRKRAQTGEPEYAVPFLPHLGLAAHAVPHFGGFEAAAKAGVNTDLTRGMIQELYIERLIRDSAPHATVIAERNRLAAALVASGCEVVPSVTNFVAFRPPDAPALADDLQRRGLIVRRYDTGPMVGWLRVTARPAAENDRLLEALEELLQ